MTPAGPAMDPSRSSLLEPRHHRLNPLWVVVASMVVLGSVAAWLFFIHDDPAPDDEHLKSTVTRHELSGNPLATYGQTSALLSSTYLSADPFDPSPSSERFKLTDPNEVKLLTAFQTLVASDPTSWQWPTPQVPSVKKTHNRWQLQQTTSFINAKAMALGDEGQVEEAADLVLSLIKLGHGLGNQESDLSDALSAATLHRECVAALYHLLRGRDIPVPILRQAHQRLTQYPPAARDKFAFARRSGYFAFKDALSQARHRSLSAGLGSYLPTGHPTPPLPLIGSPLKTNRTARMHLARAEAVLTALDQGWWEAFRVEQVFERNSTAATPAAGNWSHYVESNASGRLMHAFASRHAMQCLELVMTTHARFETTRINLALRLFEVDHQRLPHNLQSLVPTYLPAVPLDPYSGRPMLWNFETAIICALSSEGGNGHAPPAPAPLNEHDGALDFALPYGWSAAAFRKRVLGNAPVPLEALQRAVQSQ